MRIRRLLAATVAFALFAAQAIAAPPDPGEAATVAAPGPTWTSYTSLYDGSRFDIGNFPATDEFGGNSSPITQTVVATLNVPSSALGGNAGFGVAGYGATASTSVGVVGIGGFAFPTADGVSAWGNNDVIQNCGPIGPCSPTTGHNADVLYGVEVDANITSIAGGLAPNDALRGIYFQGASIVEPTNSIVAGIDMYAIGSFEPSASFTGAISGTTLTVSGVSGTIAAGATVTGAGVTGGTIIVSGSGLSWVVSNSQVVAAEAMTSLRSKVPWKDGFRTEDGASINAINIGATGTGNNVGSQDLLLTSRDGGGASHVGALVESATGDLILRGPSGGDAQINSNGNCTVAALPTTDTAGCPTTVPTLAATSALTSITQGGTTIIGTGGAVVCAGSHVCDNLSGTLSISTGTGVSAAGTFATLDFSITRTNLPNCAFTLSGGTAFVAPAATETTSTEAFSVATAFASSSTYFLRYVCGGN